LWIQQRLRRKEFELRKVDGTKNPADLFTKHMDSASKLNGLVALYGCDFRSGRPEAAPKLKKSQPQQARMAEQEPARTSRKNTRGAPGEGSKDETGRLPHNLPQAEMDALHPAAVPEEAASGEADATPVAELSDPMPQRRPRVKGGEQIARAGDNACSMTLLESSGPERRRGAAAEPGSRGRRLGTNDVRFRRRGGVRAGAAPAAALNYSLPFGGGIVMGGQPAGSYEIDTSEKVIEYGKYEGDEFDGDARRLPSSEGCGGQLHGSVRTCTHDHVERAVSARGPACLLPAGPLEDSFRTGPIQNRPLFTRIARTFVCQYICIYTYLRICVCVCGCVCVLVWVFVCV
jgi:hypothetical protein